MNTFNRSALFPLMAAAISAEGSEDGNAAAPAAPAAPAGFTAVNKVFHFRKFKDTPENRSAKLPAAASVDTQGNPIGADHEITVSSEVVEGVQVFQRTPETHTLLVPTPELFGLANTEENKKAFVVLQATLTDFMVAAARKLVDQGHTPTEENCSWALVCGAEYTRLTTSASDSGSGISSEMLKDFAAKFTAYMTALGRPETGITATSKMITGRFGRMSTMAYLPVMDKVLAGLSLFFSEGLDEAQQNGYAAVMEYLLQKAEDAQKPVEVPDIESMF